jgi:hypothetical protein
LRTQNRDACRTRSERQDAQGARHQSGDTHTHIAAADDKQAFTAKSGRQCAKGALD